MYVNQIKLTVNPQNLDILNRKSVTLNPNPYTKQPYQLYLEVLNQRYAIINHKPEKQGNFMILTHYKRF